MEMLQVGKELAVKYTKNSVTSVRDTCWTKWNFNDLYRGNDQIKIIDINFTNWASMYVHGHVALHVTNLSVDSWSWLYSTEIIPPALLNLIMQLKKQPKTNFL